jgi:nitrite reductase/ring-hydroxylating ferredoxin subunit
MSRHVVATVDEIAPGASKLVTVKEREIGLFNVAGTFYALANRCPHAGGALCQGEIVGLPQSQGPGDYQMVRKGEFLRCPWHGWEFEIATGQSYCDPKNLVIRQYPVSVAPGGELVKGPYVAETFPVSVEEQYVVIEV